MRRHPSLIICMAVTVVLITSSVARPYHQTPPFMTVDEFTTVHPEQDALMKRFNAIVNQPGIRLENEMTSPIKVAFIYPGIQASDYWTRSVNSFKRRMDEIGLNSVISEYHSKPTQEDQLQSDQVTEALQDDPDYLILTFDAFKHKTLIEGLLSRKRPRLILQNITTPLREWEGRQPFMHVGFDHAIGARILADHFIARTGGVGKYGILYFPRGYVSTMRGDIFRSYVQASSKLQLLQATYTDSTVAGAYADTIGMTKRNNYAFIYANSTDIALGAIRALKETEKLGRIMINGWGGGSSELEAIMAGDMDVTVMRMNDDNGVAMAEAIRLDVEGKGALVPTIYSGEMVLVEKGISRQELDLLIKRAFRYSGKSMSQ